MIIHTKSGLGFADIEPLAAATESAYFTEGDHIVLVTPSRLKTVPEQWNHLVESTWVFEGDVQLASRQYRAETRTITIGHRTIGGNTNHTLLIAGPCSVESEEQIRQSATLLKTLGLGALRGGCYKPRTSPYTFQGLGVEGLKLLAKMRDEFGHVVVSEVRDATHVNEVIEYADVVQIGAKSMYDHGILRACGRTTKPILLKRGFGTTLQEFVQASEFILSAGNPNVMLCERGIRTFETKTRFTLDLCGVAWLKDQVNLPIVLDPSHALGYRYGINSLARACVAMGVDALLIEVHPNPAVAKSDASQQLYHPEFETLVSDLKPIAAAVGRKLI